MKKEEIYNVTKNEFNILEVISSMMYAELGFSDVNIDSFLKEMENPDIKIIRGILGSLKKKDLINIEDNSMDYINTYNNKQDKNGYPIPTEQDKRDYTNYSLTDKTIAMVKIWKDEAIEEGYSVPHFNIID